MKKEYQMMIIAPGSDDQEKSKNLIKEMLGFLKEGWEVERADSTNEHILYLLVREVGEHKNLK